MNRDSNELHTKNWEEDTLLSRTASASSSGDDSRMTERAGNRGAGFKAFIWLVAVGLLGLILVDAIFLVVMLVHVVPSSDATAPLVFSPANDAVRPVVVRFQGELGAVNDFKGHRSTEMDHAWSSLYEVKPLIVSSEELRRAGSSSFEIPTRPGHHLVKLAVFHQLHCVDFLRKYIHKEEYIMDGSKSPITMTEHLDHCIDMLRQAILCSSHTTLIPFTWDGKGQAMPYFSNRHSCRNFDAIHEWARTREFDMEKEVKDHPREYKKLWDEAHHISEHTM